MLSVVAAFNIQKRVALRVTEFVQPRSVDPLCRPEAKPVGG
jgi:hypothetical protein